MTSLAHQPSNQPLLVPEKIAPLVLLLRGEKVLLDFELAELYAVENRVLKQAVRRNRDRFPADFLFVLTREEARAVARLRSQTVILKRGHHLKHLPYAFTEQGVAMLSGVLRSERAVQVNVAIMRAFVSLRRMLAGNDALARKLAELERRLEGHDQAIKSLFDAIRELMAPPTPPRREMGFHAAGKAAGQTLTGPGI
jgi:hypothetical protein